MPDSILIASDILSRVFVNAHKQYVKDNPPKVNGSSTQLLNLARSVQKMTGVSGANGEINDGLTNVPDNLTLQYWRDEDNLNNPVIPNIGIRFDTTYARSTATWKLVHDEWLRRGWMIKPHMQGSLESRMRLIGPANLQKLRDQLMTEMDGVTKALEMQLDIDLHRQGNNAKEFGGLNIHLPIAPAGTWLGLNRASMPEIRHEVVASTTGASSTAYQDFQGMFRRLMEKQANSGVAGKWAILAGGEWLDIWGNQQRLHPGFQINAQMSGNNTYDSLILDDALRVGGIKPTFDPSLAKLDALYSGETGLAISANAVTFSGGGSPTRQAKGLALVSAAGAVTQIIITDPGAGYTSAPTVAVAVGAGATFQAKIFSTSSGASFTTVAADDNRLGRLDQVSVTAGGTGFTPGSAPKFDRRAYIIFTPVLRYLPIQGMNHEMAIPADPVRSRSTEIQIDHGAYFYLRSPGLCGVHYWL